MKDSKIEWTTHMSELNRYWTVGKMRKHLCLRYWGSIWHVRRLPRNVVLWLTGRYAPRFGGLSPVRFDLSHRTHSQDQCWCPDGNETRYRLEFFGFGTWGWLSRNWVEYPCICDRAVWSLSPELHADEIEEYGAAKFYEEFPKAGAS